MKLKQFKKNKNIAMLFLLALTLSCCNNDDDNNSGSSLPPATQTGANTVGCLVNGEVFLPHAEGINPPVNCFYQFVDGEWYFSMSFADLRGQTNERVTVQSGKVELQEGETYVLSKNFNDDGDFTGGGGTYSLSASNRYFTTMHESGELIITRLDLSNSIISGTFWFNAVNGNGEVVKIREGRFDWDY